MGLREAGVGLLLAGVAIGSSALTMGRVRGAAWIGHGLDLSVVVQSDGGNTDAPLCADADVFYADTRQDPARVKVIQESSSDNETVVLRVLSPAAIDEPMVTVYLRAGCTQRVTRRYVLLADFPGEAPATAPAVRTSLEPAVLPNVSALVKDSDATDQNSIPVSNSNVASESAVSSQAKPVRPVTPTAPAPAKSSVRVRPPQTARAQSGSIRKPDEPPKPATLGKPRLKLDPLENLAERIRLLESNAAASPVEEVVHETSRMEQLQNDVKTLVQQASSNEATLLALRERLEKAESDRVPVGLAYALAAAILACLGALFYLWSQRREPFKWQRALPDAPMVEQRSGDRPAAPKVVAAPQVPAPSPSARAIPAAPEPDSGIDVDLMDMDAQAFGEFLNAKPTGPSELMAEVPSQESGYARLHTNPDFNSESILDLCQQVEFFDRLGKTDDAIDALEHRIKENSKDVPLIYLELLQIANSRSLKTDFRQFRDEFQELFNCNVPEFALFRDQGRSLEAYPAVLSSVTKWWGTPKVLAVLESCILRDTWEKDAHPFDMAAFKDLIALHGVARKTLELTHAAQRENTATDATASQQHIDLDL